MFWWDRDVLSKGTVIFKLFILILRFLVSPIIYLWPIIKIVVGLGGLAGAFSIWKDKGNELHSENRISETDKYGRNKRTSREDAPTVDPVRRSEFNEESSPFEELRRREEELKGRGDNEKDRD